MSAADGETREAEAVTETSGGDMRILVAAESLLDSVPPFHESLIALQVSGGSGAPPPTKFSTAPSRVSEETQVEGGAGVH